MCSDWYMLDFGMAMKSLKRPGSGFHSEWITPSAVASLTESTITRIA